MKHLATLLVTLMLALCPAAMAEESPALPAAGDQLEGFTVTQLGRIDSLNADTVSLTHDKTKARVIFVLNDDQNRGFSICFHTEPSDDTGMLHILEHASCAASAKYPGRDVFFDAISQAYLTGLNAWTSLSSTNYFACSMDENQLEVLADFYLDCSFNSALLTQPNYFYREGWRYEMASLDDPLTINGIVYNEMQGVYGSIFNAANANLNKTLFPDTYQARDSGGDPARIPDLSYDQLIAFYKECYNPGNSVTMFYGDVDMTRFLKLLNDGYFASAPVLQPAPISPGQAAFHEPVHAVYDFPAAADAEDTGAVIQYAAVLSDADSRDYVNYAVCDVITTLLADDSSPLMEALNASGIGSSYYVYANTVGSQLTLNFVAENADAGRDEAFKTLVLDEVKAMTEAGFDRELMTSAFASAELSLRLARNSGNVAQTLFETMTWIQEMGDTGVLHKAEKYQEAAQLCQPGYAEKLIEQWVVKNPHAALVTTVPVPGLLEKNEQALAQRLAALKADMTDEEKQAMVERTAVFNEWVALETPAETLSKLDVVDPAAMTISYPEIIVATETADGVTWMTAPAETDMRAIELQFDLSHLTDGELRRFSLMQSLLGYSTAEHSQQAISVGAARLINGLSSSVTLQKTEDAYRPVLDVAFFAPEESVAESVDLVMEMLAETDIEGNIDLLAQTVDSNMAAYKNPEAVYSLLPVTAAAAFDGYNALTLKLNGMDYYTEMKAVQEEYAQSPETLAASLAALRARALTKADLKVMLVGDDGTAREALLKKLSALPQGTEAPAQRDDAASPLSMAYVGTTQADYLVRAIPLKALGETLTGDKLVLNGLLSGEYLLPNLRLQMGAYNASMSVGVEGLWSVAFFRGENAFDANALINAMPDYLEALEMTQDELDSYKLPIISRYLQSDGELNDALSDMSLRAMGFTRERRLQLIQEVRDTTVEDIKALAPLLREMLEKSGTAVITVAERAAQHGDELEAVIKLP